MSACASYYALFSRRISEKRVSDIHEIFKGEEGLTTDDPILILTRCAWCCACVFSHFFCDTHHKAFLSDSHVSLKVNVCRTTDYFIKISKLCTRYLITPRTHKILICEVNFMKLSIRISRYFDGKRELTDL